MIKIARSLLAQKAYREAHAACMKVLNTNPQNGEAIFLLGVLTSEHGNYRKATDLFDRAIRSGHNKAETHAQTARCLLALSKRDEAVTSIERAIECSPEDALSLDTIGVVLSRAGLHERAVAFYRAATQRSDANAGYFYNLGAALQFMGEFDEARSAFDRAIELDPSSPKARVARVSITKQTEDDNDIPALTEAWTRRNTENADETLQLAHALAKASEDLDKPDLAMDWLARGKSAKMATLKPREEEDVACFSAARQIARILPVEAKAMATGPVFILGMPRTGTTLTDRILSSHSQMSSAGELSDFSIALKRETGTPGGHVLDEATLLASETSTLSTVGSAYKHAVRNTLGLQGRFTDKMPLNVFFAPAILSAMPDAQVICMRRHPADTVLSNYRQLFATAFSYYTYAYDLEDTARYVVQFNQMIEHFERVLPPSRFTILNYEDIVADTEGETRRMLDFCGLAFEPECLEFHKSSAPVATASATQVRQPIYTSSLARWKRYRPAMDPALYILKEAGLLTEET